MKNKIFLILNIYFFVGIILISCTNEETPTGNDNSYKSISDIELNLPKLKGRLEAQNLVWGLFSQPFVSGLVSGYIFKEPGNDSEFVDGGVMIISDTLLKYNQNSNPPYGFYMSTINIQPTFGDYSHWSIAGDSNNNIPAFDTIMYCPKTIFLLSYPNEIIPTINKNEDFIIKWNKDNNNNNGVEIIINLSSSKIKKTIKYLVEDNGVFTISLKEIQSHSISLDIRRYNQMLIKIKGYYFWLFSITDASQDYKLVDN